MKRKIAAGEDRFYTFLGLNWDLVDNTLTPNMYFNLDKKHQGTTGTKKLKEMNSDDFCDKTFACGITRRTISRLCAQAYSKLAAMMSTVVMNLKVCVSRSCEIMGSNELDTPVAVKDATFARIVAKVCQELPKLKD